MTNNLGMLYDGAVLNIRRLTILHVCLAAVVALTYWVAPGTAPVPLRWTVPHYADVTPILVTITAWIPYVISAMVSRRLLVDRSPKATLVFIIIATLIAAASGILYLNLLRLSRLPSPMLVSIAVTFALVGSAYACSAVMHNKVQEE